MQGPAAEASRGSDDPIAELPRPPSSLDPMGQGLWVAGLELAAVQFLKIRLVKSLVEFKIQGSHLYLPHSQHRQKDLVPRHCAQGGRCKP